MRCEYLRDEKLPRPDGIPFDRSAASVSASAGRLPAAAVRQRAAAFRLLDRTPRRVPPLPNPRAFCASLWCPGATTKGAATRARSSANHIHLLLVELLNVGQLSPYDAFWVSRRDPALAHRAVVAIARCASAGPARRTSFCRRSRQRRRARAAGKVVDGQPSVPRSCSDAGPDQGRNRTVAGSGRPLDDSAPIRRGRQLKLLRKVHAICQPNLESGSSVVAIACPLCRRSKSSWACLISRGCCGTRSAREPARRRRRCPKPKSARAAPRTELTPDAPLDFGPAGGQGPCGANDEFGAPHQEWQLKDSSASGCRLRGKIANPNRVLPGTLLAFRVGDNLPWTLAVVRRFRKRIGDRVDIGVEYVGRRSSGCHTGRRNRSRRSDERQVGQEAQAVHRPLSSGELEHPKMPFKDADPVAAPFQEQVAA